jgi:hypothetical protein
MHTKNQRALLKRHIADRVALGFTSRAAIVREYTKDLDEKMFGQPEESAVKIFVDEAIRSHHAKQATWTKPTDCDKLDAAFRALNRRGIVARQHYSCCACCGIAEIAQEMGDAENRGKKVIGYAFYHQQSTDYVLASGRLSIYYWSWSMAPEDVPLQVGRTIAEVLAGAGLKPKLVGNSEVVVTVKWRKRRKDRFPRADGSLAR